MTIAVRWTPGPHHGVVWPGGALVLGGDLPVRVASALLTELADRAPATLVDAQRRVDRAAPAAACALVVRGRGGLAAARRVAGSWHEANLGAGSDAGPGAVVRITPEDVGVEVAGAGHDARPLGLGLVPVAELWWEEPALSGPGPEPTVVLPVTSPAAPVSSPPGLITGVPRAVPPAAPAPPAPSYAGAAAAPSPAAPAPPALPDDTPDHDGLTVVPATRGGRPVGASAPGDPRSVLALVCPEGHPNPAARTVCRTCGLTLAGPAERVPRPPLGVVRSSAGDLVELSAPVVVGRNPRARRDSPEPPLLLALPQPHVSGSHLELRPDGWTLLAVDLESTNGTFLRRRGEPTMRLSGTPTPLVDGDVVDLGHGVFLTVEGLP